MIMYLSILLIDLGENPDRPRPGRFWLRNLYRVHQRLCMAFPSPDRKNRDPHFLAPFAPSDFGNEQVHVRRGQDAGFLFRVDPLPQGRAAIVVQSSDKPDWDYAFYNASYLLAAAPECRQFQPRFAEGQKYRFRLQANPTRRLSSRSLGPDGRPLLSGVGKRVPVPPDQLDAWLLRRAEPGGFALVDGSLTIQAGYLYVNKERNQENSGIRLRSCRYEGMLLVVDPNRFLKAVVRGIGPAKAFGFGLLSLARIDT